jgi:ATP-dependent RNA helicase DHX57
VSDGAAAAAAAAAAEREVEQEALEAIYGNDVKVGEGAVKDYPDAWSVVLKLGSGIPGLALNRPVQLCVVDVDGLYPLTPPAVFIAPGDDSLARARRRAAMRAAASEVEAARSGVKGSPSEPVHVVHAVVSMLSDASEEDLLAAAASARPAIGARKPPAAVQSGSAPSATATPGGDASPRSHPTVGRPSRRKKGGPSGHGERPQWRAPRPVHPSNARPAALAAMAEKRKALPAFKSRTNIVDVIRRNQVTVISGATGSGKTTQVPQYLLEDAAGTGEPISIACTQPRRIAAMSVARRVASERCEQAGQSTGYQVKLNSKRSSETRLMFCTTGVLLRQMQSDPELRGLTHIVVDEVHERSVETDFVLLLVRDILPQRPSLRVVLMSATLDASKFSHYFSSLIAQPVPVISIPGRTHPVTELYLEDAIALTEYRLRAGDRYAKKQWVGGRPAGGNGRDGPRAAAPGRQSATLAARADDPLPGGDDDDDVPDDWEDGDGNDGGVDSGDAFGRTRRPVSARTLDDNAEAVNLVDESLVNIDLIEMLVRRLDAGAGDQSAGAILVFLPGMAEISTLVERLSRDGHASKLFAMPLHSALSPDEQAAVFERPPRGRRKVICSTNIAETSLTVEDVTFVIDTARVKEMSYDALNGTSVLAETFISQAAARQRSGRAGRVSKGTCYRLVRRATFDNKLAPQQEPEIRRVSLEHLVLNLLSITPAGSAERNPHEFLARALDPPSAAAISAAVSNLVAIGALEAVDSLASGSIRLTALGRHLSGLPVDARIGKLLIYGALFGCLDVALTIAATLSERSPFFSPRDKRDEARRARERFKWGQSDLLMYVRAFDGWREARAAGGGFRAELEYCDRHFMSRKTLVAIGDVRAQLLASLQDAGFGGDVGGGAGLNRNNGETRVVRAVVCAALYPNVVRIDLPDTKYAEKAGGAVSKSFTAKELKMRGKSGERVFLHPDSINFDEGNFGSRWLAYFSKVQTSRVFVRDSTMVSPYAILLFGGDIDVRHAQEQLAVDGWVVFKSPARVAVLVRELRRNLDGLLLRKFRAPDLDVAADAQGRAISDAILRIILEESR